MAIVLKYGSPGPILAAGYAAGAGHQMHQQQDDALKVWQQNSQRDFQAQQSWLDRYQQNNLQQNAFAQQNQQAAAGRNFQADQQLAAQGFQSTQAGRARDFQAGQTDKMLTARAGESALDAERRIALQQQHEQFLRDQNAEVGLRRGELSLPPAAQDELNKLEAGAVAASKMDPDKKAEFMSKYSDRKRELYGMAKPTNTLPYDERLKQSLGANYEQYKNLPWQFNEQGDRSLPAGFKMPGDDEAKQAAASQKQIEKYYSANRKIVNENGKPKYSTPEEAMTAAMTEHSTVQGMLRGEKPDPPPPAISPQDIATSSPQNIQNYNRMQNAMGKGAQAWTNGSDKNLAPGQSLFTYPNEAAQSIAGSNPGVSAPFVPVPGAAQAAAPAAPADFDRQWADLKPGESLRGPDGKLYTKRNK